jgi:hypothetical protein
MSILIINISLYAEEIKIVYSIQILSTKSLDEAKEYYEKFKNYPYARVEKIGKYYVLRIGNSKTVKNLKPLLKEVEKLKKDAFIRIADILPDRIIVANFELAEKENKEKIKKVEKIVIKPKIKVETKIETKKKPKEKPQKEVKDIFSIIPSAKIKENKEKLKESKKEVKFEPYAILSLEMAKTDKEGINKTLKTYKNTLPYRDKLQAEIITGQINKAYKTSYRNLRNSYFDYLAYKQSRDLYMDYSNRFNIDTSYNHIEDFSSLNLNFQLRKYLFKGFYLYLNNINYFITHYDKGTYKNLSNIDSSFSLALKKLFDASNLYVEFGFRKAQKTFLTLLTKYTVINNKYLTSSFLLALNQPSFESTQMFLGGLKNFIGYEYSFNINSKNIVSGDIKANYYTTQDFKNKGKGFTFSTNYLHKYRVGYPDFSTYAFLNGSIFNEKTTNSNLLNKILLFPNAKILPENFLETGIGFLFGLDYREIYQKQVRPFLDTNIAYNTAYGIGYSLSAGLGGQIFDEDNLSAWLSFGRGFSGQPYTIFRLYISYKKWF